MVIVLVVAGIAGLLAGLWGAGDAHRRIRSQRLGWWRLQWLPIAGGAAASVLLSFRRYPATPATEVLGIPFPVAAFEGGRDFVGVASLPLALANVGFFLLIPQVALAIYLRFRAVPAKPKSAFRADAIYVVSTCCLDCGIPWALAPEVFAAGSESCVVKRQPSGATELRRVLRVFRSQELTCIRYGGRNPRARAILERVGCADACDDAEAG